MNDPNTEYILSLSYGKDSLACLEACRQLGYRIDRVVHAEVWATDTIPADLPPMVEFKAKADAIIKERYGLTVEHICARAREKLTYERQFYTECISKRFGKQCYGFPVRQHPWCVDRLKDRAFDLVRKTYLRENLLPPNETQDSERERERIYGFPILRGNWCTSNLKQQALRLGGVSSAQGNSRNKPLWISNLGQARELVYQTQTAGFQIAPLHKVRKQILCSTSASPQMSLSV